MSDMNDLATAASAIADPTTSAADLATIAEVHPSLRTAVALHPNVYPGLLDWLDGLGDPTLTRAVASRRAKDTGTSVSTPPVAPAYGSTSGYAAVGAMAGTTVGANGYAEPPYPNRAYSPMSPISARTATRMPIVAAILFFVGAAAALVDCGISGFNYCRTLWQDVVLFPWGWSTSFSYYCAIYGVYDHSTFATVFSVLAILAMVGCGIACLVIGKKDIRQAAFLSGILLTCLTVISTIVAIVDIVGYVRQYSGYGYAIPWSTIIKFLVFLAVPGLLTLLAKVSSQKLLEQLRTALLIAAGIVLVSSGVYAGGRVLLVILENGLFFAAIVILAFAIPRLSPQETPRRNTMLYITSILAIAGGAAILLFSLSNISIGYFYHATGVRIVILLCGAYMVVAGVLGLMHRTDPSKTQLLMGLGIGLIVAQVSWFLNGDFVDNIVYILGFVTVSVLYLVAATKMNKPPKTQLAGQAYMGEQPYVPGQPYPVQQYAGAQPPPQPYMAGQPQPYVVPQPYPNQYGVYDAPNTGYAVLGFFIPLVGLILYLTWKDQTPLRAKSAGKGALIGVIVSVALTIIYFIVIAVIVSSIGRY